MTNPTTEQQPGTAVARRHAEPGKAMDLDQVHYLAKGLALAQVVPQQLQGKPWDLVAMILYGQDLGLSPMQAIQGIYVVKGKPQLAAQTWIALARRAGHNPFVACKECDVPPEQHKPGEGHRYQADHDATRCTITIVRGDTGSRHTETFTWADADRAKLTGKDVWKQYPKRMLLARAASDCCRVICPEIALGFYAEGDDFTDDVDSPIQVQTPIEAERDIADAEIVDDKDATEQVAQMAERFNFAQPAPPVSDDGQGDPPPPADYVCTPCGTRGEHYEDECPQGPQR